MLKMFFITAIRNFYRNLGFSLLNIIGLAVGVTACILISLFVWDEHQFDKGIPQGERIYRLYVNRVTENANEQVAMVPPVFAPTLQNTYPEVERTMRFLKLNDKALIEHREKSIYHEGGIIADTSFFDIFPLRLVFGSVKGALNERGSVVISEELSSRMFDGADPIGKILVVNKDSFEVRAVFRNDPRFHLNITYMLPMKELLASIPEERMRSWGWMQFNTYVKVKPGIDVRALEKKFQSLAHKEGSAFSVGEQYGIIPKFQQLKDVHLHSRDFKYDMSNRGNILYVRTLTIIAIFILLIACFNFINLATARSLKRAREVGVRKSLGAGRAQLMLHFIGETVMLTLAAIVLSVFLVYLFLPALNSFTGKSMHLPLFSEPLVSVLLIALGLLVGLFAGFYPSLVLSGFVAVRVLKGQVLSQDGGNMGHLLRRGLVIAQFTISVALIISAIVVYNQVNFLHSKDLGFNKENILFFQMRGNSMFSNYETFKNELLKLPAVSSVSMGYGFPGNQTAGDQIIVPAGGERSRMPVTQLMVDHDYIKTLGLKLIAGRDFSRSMSTDPDRSFIINETAVREMGFGTPAKALGKTLYWPMWIDGKDTLKEGKVIGVVRDFHFKSLYDRLESAVLQIYPPAYWKVAVKFNAADVTNLLKGVEATWNRFSPSHPFEYRFMDDNFSALYKTEEKLRSLLWIFTGMAIFVGCLGLFGLASFAAEKRKKEIGIRKVLGASVTSVVVMLCREFVQLVLIAMLIASPMAYWAMHNWLQDFPYRVGMNFWIFPVAGGLTILVSLLTVGFQALKAAIVNPVNSLRTE